MNKLNKIERAKLLVIHKFFNEVINDIGNEKFFENLVKSYQNQLKGFERALLILGVDIKTLQEKYEQEAKDE